MLTADHNSLARRD